MLKTTDISPLTAAYELDKGEESFRRFLRMNQIGVDHYFNSKTLLHNEISVKSRVALLIKLDANILLPTNDKFRLTALHLATICSEDQSLNLFLIDLKRSGRIEEGINIKDGTGNSPLHYACISAHEKSIDLLLEYGADTSVRNNEGKLPIECLDELKRLDPTQRAKLEKKLRDHSDTQKQNNSSTPIPITSKPMQRKNSMERTQSPTTFFGPVRQKTPSPPQGGSLSGSPESGEHSPKSSDASHTQQDVDEALFKACVEGDLAEAQDLVENCNGNVNYTTSPDNFTPLQASIVRGHPLITKYLLKMNADPNFPNSEGSTPLDLAVTKELTDIVSLLLDAGANPDPVHSAKELSPLMFAARFGNLRIVQLLTEKGANPTLKSIALNANAIELATAAKHFEIATYLESYNKEKIPNPLLKAIQDGKQQKKTNKTCLIDSVAVQGEGSHNIDVTQKPEKQKCLVM